MANNFNLAAILAIAFFVIPIGYKVWNKQKTELSDLAKCTLAAMGLPNLAICLFHLITNPAKALEMTEVTQYLTVAVLVIAYLTIQEIKKTFEKKAEPPG